MARARPTDRDPKPEPVPAEAPLAPSAARRAIAVRPEDVERAAAVLEKYREPLLRRKGVTGVGVGLRHRRKPGASRGAAAEAGPDLPAREFETTSEVCIVVNVARKIPAAELSKLRALPLELDGVPIDVQQGTFEASQASDPASRYVDPVVAGAGIAAEATPGNFGTLGLVVRAGGAPHYLTAGHLIPAGAAAVVVQPPGGGAIPPGGTRAIGRSSPITRSVGGLLDCVLIEPDAARPFAGGLPVSPPLTGPLVIRPGEGQVTLLLGEPVEKLGAVTGRTTGVVVGINKSFRSSSGVTYRNQFTVRSTDGTPFSQPGDSGAVVIRRLAGGGAEVVGVLHHLLEDGAAAACHMFLVAARLGVEV